MAGLNIFVSICGRYAASHGLNYSVKKTVLMEFKYGREPDIIPFVTLNGTTLSNV